jgi:hypothetical protein
MTALKSRITNLVVHRAVILISLIAVCITCSTSKSAGPQSQLAENKSPLSQSPAQVSSSPIQESGPCTLKVSEAPVLNGLKLGMTPEQVLALFPGSKDDPELRSTLSTPPGRFGNSSVLITPSKYGSAAQYKGISRLTFSLLDGHVSNFTISYNGPEWPDVDKFIQNFVEGKHLPPAGEWAAYEGMNTQMKTLTCNNFSIQIFAGGEGGSSNYVLVEDLEADKKLKERRKKAREQASPPPTTAPTPSR